MNMLSELAEVIEELRSTNAQLRARVLKLTRSRDEWKRKAKMRRRAFEELKRQPRSRKPPRKYTVDEWRQHALIVARIRAIPNRPSGWEELVGVKLEAGVTLVRDNDILTP